ncbi:26S proteasome non-ATPase regulatory subunit 12 A [Venturia nashicola]|nr:26S proteasome non-ATPase regulatory subunit 12 A [Venturia nashicola]
MANPPPKPALQFPPESRIHIEPYLPPYSSTPEAKAEPFLTLTFATSLDSSLSLAAGTQTILSGSETKAMTHYLRSRHDAILVGVGTAVADNPALNCRIEGIGLEAQPRPVILDPQGRFEIVNEKGVYAECVRLAREGVGKGPLILTSNLDRSDGEWNGVLKACGGRYIVMPLSVEEDGFSWTDVLAVLSREGIKSLMVEGGAHVINTLLQEKYLHFVDSVIVTIAPVWLGQGGVAVSPPRAIDAGGKPKAAARLKEVKWQQYGEDAVLCGRMN